MTVTAGAATRLDDTVATVEAELARLHVPGLELAVVADGGELFAGGVGVRGVDDPQPVTASTLFHHGSCGKAYTGLLAALLAEDGVLDLDAPVRRYVPELRLPDPVVAERVTMRDLLSHRSGLGRHDMSWILHSSWTRSDVIARMEHLSLVGDLRAQWSYSNFGFTLAGEAIGRATGSSWEQQLRTRVLEPLGMSRSAPSHRVLLDDADAATPHVIRDDRPVRTPVRPSGSIAPAGGVVSCAADSVRWLLAQLGSGAVSAEAVRVAQQPQMLLPAGPAPLPEWDLVAYGFGWVLGRFRDRPLVWHNGGIDGFSTYTMLLPEDGIGVLACANAYPGELPLAVVLTVADALTGDGSEGSWFDRLLSGAQHDDPAAAASAAAASAAPASAGTAAAAAPEPRPAADDVPRPSHALAAYDGVFNHPGYGDLHVTVSGDDLTLRLGDGDFVTKHRHYDVWDLHYEPLDARFTVTFITDPDGTIGTVRVTQDGDAPLDFRRTAQPT